MTQSEHRKSSFSADALESAHTVWGHANFLTTAPSGRLVKAYMDTVMLLATFMFAFAAVHISAIEREDLFDADSQWQNFCSGNVSAADEPIYNHLCVPFSLPSQTLSSYVTITYVVLGSSVLVAIASYLAIILSQIDENTESWKLRRWWKFYQWPMHLSMLLLTVGIVFYGITLEFTARIVFIDLLHASDHAGFVWGEIAAFNLTFLILSITIVYMIVVHCFFTSRRLSPPLVTNKNANQANVGDGLDKGGHPLPCAA